MLSRTGNALMPCAQAIVLVIGLATVGVAAAQAQDASTEEETLARDAATAAASASSKPTGTAASPNGASTAAPASAAARSAQQGSPLDYEASEQISEDLPVSFPVDI